MLDMNKEADGPIATALSYDIEELEFEANSLDIEQKDRNNLFSLGMIVWFYQMGNSHSL
jgi:hypothetical protein